MGQLLRRSGNAVYNVCLRLGWYPDVVIQVGVGGYHQEVDVIREAWPETKFVGFDPLMVKDYPGEFYQMAIGDENKRAPFYVKRRHQDGSSVFPLPDGQLRRTDEIDVRTLDSLLLNDVSGRTLLWLDCEGSELNALRGGEALLKDIEMVNVELTAKPGGNHWTSPVDIYRHLADRGFLMLWVHTMRIPDGQYDAVFVRRHLFKDDCCCIPSEIERFHHACPPV